jgi:hypothetical protein
MYFRKMGVEFIMTEIISKEIKNRGICIIDNHKGKTRKYYTILVSNLTEEDAKKYIKIKGMI